ncbi:MAG: 2TM domain-containing protein [Saprospiraceae bacterium]|nr:2TM domain-containing protein [Saprospiraceae bacterium]
MTDNAYDKARKNVKRKKGFYKHLAAYIIINTFFLITNGFEFGPWLPWGIGLAFHYVSVFGFPGSGILSREWEERELEREMKRTGASKPLELNPGGEPLPDFKKADPEVEEQLNKLPRDWSEKDLV